MTFLRLGTSMLKLIEKGVWIKNLFAVKKYLGNVYDKLKHLFDLTLLTTFLTSKYYAN